MRTLEDGGSWVAGISERCQINQDVGTWSDGAVRHRRP